MPGKVNPTQSESMMMVCYQVFGNDVTMGMAGASGVLELNVAKPVIIANFLHSVEILAGSAHSFVDHCLTGLTANEETLSEHLQQTLMLVTALAPHIGYDQAAAIAKQAHKTGSSLKQTALSMGAVTEAQYDQWVKPTAMLKPSGAASS